MKLFTCTDHAVHWPVGGASVIVAETKERAEHLLRLALLEHGLKDASELTLTEVPLNLETAIVLRDGDY